ncbi:MAG: adenylosuccinate synthetase [Nanoarchaeota archaeon]|nr:adenylosuccinate synthetase [Nanoarchaeota archaeon]MBU1030166.1 adenylosuccinate synthetase [Nanoarchaeota archaeon]MBU1849391.1 adenylosuccinate synthetase [Nanoarchaeota archaeon]
MVKKGKSTVLIGLQYGDEGKARVMDTMLKYYDVVARFNGGANAGHTLEVGNIKIALHQIPSGIFYKDKLLYVGNGCVINPKKFLLEIKEVESYGLKLNKRLLISSLATIIQPHHIYLDGLFGGAIGSTNNGIGPAYSDRAMRAEGRQIKNIRMGDYFSDTKKFKQIVKENLLSTIKKHNLKGIIVETEVNSFHQCMLKIKKFLCSDVLFMEKMVSKGKNVFFEGAQSIMLDVVYGCVPYMTSSRTVAAAAYTGGDLSLKYHDKTIGVAKAIMSRVGNGPFISEFGGLKSENYCMEGSGYTHIEKAELKNSNPLELLKSNDLFNVGKALRMLTGEYGATTKRPRRIGMLDLVMLRQNCSLNGVDELHINKFDCLKFFSQTTLPGIPLVVAYELNGKKIDYMPSSEYESRNVKPIIKYLSFIKEDISKIKTYEKLPDNVKKLISFIEKFVNVKIAGIGVGPEREQFIKINKF